MSQTGDENHDFLHFDRGVQRVIKSFSVEKCREIKGVAVNGCRKKNKVH